jgi:hypothetical protein
MLKPILRSINRFLPPRGREFSRFAYAGVKSLVDIPLKNKLFDDKADLVPPLYLMRDGNPDYREFKQNGSVWFNRFLSFGLKPADRVGRWLWNRTEDDTASGFPDKGVLRGN